MGNEQSGNGQPTASDKTSEVAVPTEAPPKDSADETAEDEAPETEALESTEAPESDTPSSSPSEPGNGAKPPEGGSPTAASAPASRQGPVVLAIVAVLALIVGLVVGLVVGGSSSDDDGDETASEDDSEGHAGDEEGMSDEESGLAQLLADHHYHAPTDETIDAEDRALLTAQLAPLDEWVQELPTIADAEAADWRRAGPFIPGLGTHYIPRDQSIRFTIRESLDGDEDEGTEVRPLLIYDGLQDDSALAGFMLMAEDDPGDFAGPYDPWHQHTNVCVVITEGEDGESVIDLPFVGDMDSTTEERCEGVGGSLTELTSHMVHVWTIPSYDSELGMFSEINPKITCADGTYHRVPYDELEPPFTTTCPGEVE